MRKTTKLMNEMKELNIWRHIPCSCLQRQSTKSVLSNLIYIVHAVPTKISASYFVDIDKWILSFIWRGKRPRIASTEGEQLSSKTDTIQL